MSVSNTREKKGTNVAVSIRDVASAHEKKKLQYYLIPSARKEETCDVKDVLNFFFLFFKKKKFSPFFFFFNSIPESIACIFFCIHPEMRARVKPRVCEAISILQTGTEQVQFSTCITMWMKKKGKIIITKIRENRRERKKPRGNATMRDVF